MTKVGYIIASFCLISCSFVTTLEVFFYRVLLKPIVVCLASWMFILIPRC